MVDHYLKLTFRAGGGRIANGMLLRWGKRADCLATSKRMQGPGLAFKSMRTRGHD